MGGREEGGGGWQGGEMVEGGERRGVMSSARREVGRTCGFAAGFTSDRSLLNPRHTMPVYQTASMQISLCRSLRSASTMSA